MGYTTHREIEGERERNSNVLVHSPDVSSGQSQARLKLEVRNTIQVSSCRHQRINHLYYHLLLPMWLINKKLKLGMELGPKLRHCATGCRHPKQ